jgi:ribonuclease BN (tRNA processing enzyme)
VPFSYALTYAPRQQPVPVDRWPGTDTPARPVLHAPAGARDTFRRVVGAWGNEDLIENAFALHEYGAAEVLEIGSLRLRFHEVPHFMTTHAIDVLSTNGGGRFTYGADCRPTEALVAFARDTDLLMVEATLPRPERTGARGHVITHISDELDELWARERAQDAFGDRVEVAAEGAVYTV